jgi:hypothetical protein
VSTLEKSCFWITTPPGLATRLYSQNSREVHAGCLIIWYHDYSHWGKSADNIIAVLECSDRVRQISLQSAPSSYFFSFGSDAESFPELTSLEIGSYGMVRVLPDSFMSGRLPSLSVSRFTKSTFICHPPRLSSPRQYSSSRVHFTRGDAFCPLHVDQPQIT